MSEELLIYAKVSRITMDIVLPRELFGSFAVQFADEFAYECLEGELKGAEMDGYETSNGLGWHVFISVKQAQEERLIYFLKEFSRSSGLVYRDIKDSGK